MVHLFPPSLADHVAADDPVRAIDAHAGLPKPCINTEVVWLCQQAQPGCRTMAGFRHNSGKSLKGVSRAFVRACRDLSLVGEERVAVDGTFLKAGNNRGSVHAKAGLERSLARPGRLIEAHCLAIDRADAVEADGDDPSAPSPVPKMEELPARRAGRKALQLQLEAEGVIFALWTDIHQRF